MTKPICHQLMIAKEQLRDRSALYRPTTLEDISTTYSYVSGLYDTTHSITYLFND